MKILIPYLFLSLIFISCAPVEEDEESLCPEDTAAVSATSISGPESAVALHANGINTTWTWQLSGTINRSYNVDVYDVDLFDKTQAQITQLKNEGRTVVCYFSAGSSENWRDDFDQFASADMGSTLDGWEGERWLDVRSANVISIMRARMDLALAKGCDGVEPDNMDGYMDGNEACFGYTSDNQLHFNKTIANYARSIGLSVGLKNDGEQVAELVTYFDFSLSEQCYQYNECESYQPFIDAGKPVLNAEYADTYVSDASALCSYSTSNNIRTLVLALELDDSYRNSCD